MPLPFTINTTYAPGSQVKSADLNAIQVAIKDRHNKSLHFQPGSFYLSSPADWIVYDTGALAASVVSTGAKSGFLDITPWLIPGDTVKEFVARWANGATPSAGTITFRLHRTPFSEIGNRPPVPGAQWTTAQTTNTGASLAARSVTHAVAHTVLADNFYLLQFDMDATAGDDQAGFGGFTLVLGA